MANDPKAALLDVPWLREPDADAILAALDARGFEVVAKPSPPPHEWQVDSRDLVVGAFQVRGQPVNENDRGAWMVHLPTGIGVAFGDLRTQTQNLGACAAALMAATT